MIAPCDGCGCAPCANRDEYAAPMPHERCWRPEDSLVAPEDAALDCDDDAPAHAPVAPSDEELCAMERLYHAPETHHALALYGAVAL